MIRKAAFLVFTSLASNAFSTGLEIDRYAFQSDFRTYTPAESCAKANEALKLFTKLLSDKAEQQHTCLQSQLSENDPRPTLCTSNSESYLSHSYIQQYELLRWMDCNPKRDPAYPRRTSAYKFLEN